METAPQGYSAGQAATGEVTAALRQVADKVPVEAMQVTTGETHHLGPWVNGMRVTDTLKARQGWHTAIFSYYLCSEDRAVEVLEQFGTVGGEGVAELF